MSKPKRHSVWVVQVAWQPDGTIQHSTRRLLLDELDESQASMAILAIANMSKQPEFELPLREDYEPVSIWETQASDI